MGPVDPSGDQELFWLGRWVLPRGLQGPWRRSDRHNRGEEKGIRPTGLCTFLSQGSLVTSCSWLETPAMWSQCPSLLHTASMPVFSDLKLMVITPFPGVIAP